MKKAMISSDAELQTNAHPATPEGGAPVLDGRPNVNAMREALEAQDETEVGKPILEKQQELKQEGKAVSVEKGSGTQIIINIASKVAFTLNGKKMTREFSTPEVAQAFIKGASAKFGKKIAFFSPEDAKAFHDNENIPADNEEDQKWEPVSGEHVDRKQALKLNQQFNTPSTIGQFLSSKGFIQGTSPDGRPQWKSQTNAVTVEGERWSIYLHATGGTQSRPAKSGYGLEPLVKFFDTNRVASKMAGFNFFFPGQALSQFYPELLHEIVDSPNANNTPMQNAPELDGDASILEGLDTSLPGLLDAHEGLNEATTTDDIQQAIMNPLEGLDTVDDITSAIEACIDPTIIATVSSSVSTSPAAGCGLGRDGKSQVLEGTPLRKENDIRNPGAFMDEFYGATSGISGAALNGMFASKKAADDEGGEIDDKAQFSSFLKRVMGEIVATFLAAFKVTNRVPLNKVPGIGELSLMTFETPMNLGNSVIDLGSRVKHLVDKLNDSDLKEAINDAWSQGAIWCNAPIGGFAYEVFVRAETIDTDTLIMKYRFVCGTKS